MVNKSPDENSGKDDESPRNADFQSPGVGKPIGIEQLVHGYFAARGEENVAQLAVNSQDLEAGLLCFTVCRGDPRAELPDIVREHDTVEISGRTYSFHFEETMYGPQSYGRLTLYASEDILGMRSLDLEQGLEDLKNAVNEVTIDIEDLVELVKSRSDALAVTASVAGDYLRLDLVRHESDLADACTERYGHISRIVIGNEEREVRINDWRTEDHVSDSIVVWRSEAADTGEPINAKDGIEALVAEL